MDSFSHYLECLCSHYYHHVAIAIRLLEETSKQYTEFIFHDFLFQDTTPSSGSVSCSNTQEHSDMLVLCLLFLWQRRNDTALHNIRDQMDLRSELLRPLLFNLQTIWHFWLRSLPWVCFWVSQHVRPFRKLHPNITAHCLTAALLSALLREKTYKDYNLACDQKLSKLFVITIVPSPQESHLLLYRSFLAIISSQHVQAKEDPIILLKIQKRTVTVSYQFRFQHNTEHFG